MSDIRIPDIAEFQGLVDHPALVAGLRQAYGAAIVIARVNYGNTAIDQQADRNIDGLRAAGTDAIGWYCYLISSQDPVAQADTFCRVLQAHGGLRRNELVVCDDEEGSGDQSSRVDAFLARVDAVLQADTAQDAWYSGLNFAQVHNLPAANGHRWIAAYQDAEPTSVAHDLWQFTDAMSFPGIANPCDASVFHGTLSDFLALIGAGGTFMSGPLDDPAQQEALADDALRVRSILTDGIQSAHDWAAGTTVQRPEWNIYLYGRFDQQDAMLRALLADAGAEQAGIDAIKANGAAASAVAALASSQAALKSELDTVAGEVASGQPPNLTALFQLVAAVDGHLATLRQHLGDTAP